MSVNGPPVVAHDHSHLRQATRRQDLLGFIQLREPPMQNHEIVRQKVAEAGSHFVSVHFIKQDGSERVMVFNPLHFGEVKGTGHPIKDPEAKLNIFKVMDIKKGWRSFDCRRVFRIKVGGQVTDLTPEV